MHCAVEACPSRRCVCPRRLFPLRSILTAEQFDELFRELEQMEKDIVSELGKVRLN